LGRFGAILKHLFGTIWDSIGAIRGHPSCRSLVGCSPPTLTVGIGTRELDGSCHRAQHFPRGKCYRRQRIFHCQTFTEGNGPTDSNGSWHRLTFTKGTVLPTPTDNHRGERSYRPSLSHIHRGERFYRPQRIMVSPDSHRGQRPYRPQRTTAEGNGPTDPNGSWHRQTFTEGNAFTDPHCHTSTQGNGATDPNG
jgi:hypothetical protein